MIADKEIRSMRASFKELEKEIEAAKRIVLYRHRSPDYDALGSQMGLATWIKESYPEKEVHVVGDVERNLMDGLFPVPEKLPESWYANEHLAIVTDVSNRKRIADDHIGLARKVIKIDHHNPPQPEEEFGDLRIVYPDRPAASEIVALFLLSRGSLFHKGKPLSKAVAEYLYCGIVGDTGRFQYQDTDGATLRIAADLLDCGADKTSIYRKMYRTDARRLAILQFCLSHYCVTEKGTCYYVISKEDLDRLSMTTSEGNLHINVFRDMAGVKAVVSVTYDTELDDYRVSLRSASTVLYPAVQAFNGGGHDYSAGCHLSSLDQLPQLLQAVDDLK